MKKYTVLFALAGAGMSAAFFLLVNLLTSPGYLWFVYPVFAVLWWPLSVYFVRKKAYTAFSAAAAAYLIAFFILLNFMHFGGYIWFYYPAFALLWWPLSMLLAKRDTIKLYAIVMSTLTILFLLLINLLHFGGYLWFYYPVYAILWWPLSMLLARRKTIKLYAIVMSALTLVFLLVINLLNSPGVLWFQYVIFYLLWWPAVMLLGKRAKSLWFAVIGGVLIVAYHAMLYYVLTPGVYMWYLNLIPPAVLWPLCTALGPRAKRPRFIIPAALAVLVFYTALNFVLRYDWVMNELLRLQ